MQTFCHCICMRVVSHSDTVSIATLFTRELGTVAVAVRMGNNAEGRRRRAVLSPMSRFCAVVSSSRRGGLSTLGDISMSPGAPPDGNPVRALVSAFLADFLCTVLRESQPDPVLFDFIDENCAALARATGTTLANFHLLFLLRMARRLGIAPDMSAYRPGCCLDLREGVFTATPPPHRDYVDAAGATFLHALSRANMRSLGLIRLSRDQRNHILDTMLAYYTMHLAPVSHLPSLQIARDLLR